MEDEFYNYYRTKPNQTGKVACTHLGTDNRFFIEYTLQDFFGCDYDFLSSSAIYCQTGQFAVPKMAEY